MNCCKKSENFDILITNKCLKKGKFRFYSAVMSPNDENGMAKSIEPGARFTKYLKPKIFLSAIQIVWHLRKS